MPTIDDSKGKKKKPKYVNPRAKKVYAKKGTTAGKTVKYAVSDINAQFDTPVVKRTPKKGKADVVVKANLKSDKYLGVSGKNIRLNKRYLSVPTTEHEIAHQFYLGHTKGKNNLMNPYGEGTTLSPRQKGKIRRQAGTSGVTRLRKKGV